MEIKNCKLSDMGSILSLYEAARALQTERGMVVWPEFEPSFVEKEVLENRQWKGVVGDQIVCNWAITFEDKEIWGEMDQNDAVYIHRLCTHPHFRGNRYIDSVVQWAKEYAGHMGRNYVRLDTLGNNTKLIEHYTSSGFTFLGIFHLTDTATLPLHYQQEPDCCLFEMEVGKYSVVKPV